MANKRIFQQKLLNWYDKHGRKDLPWQVENPYYVWISEIMLQQTQVKKVIGYFNRFIIVFPNLKQLAAANVDDVLRLWSGLGYYSRARNIHKTAVICQRRYGNLPQKQDELLALPGIGKTTAAAILSLTWNKPFAILDGNVKRVMSRVFRLTAANPSQLDKLLWQKAETMLSQKRAKNYNQALMDLGSLLCTRSKPKCKLCPLITLCDAYKYDEIELFPQKKVKTKQIPVTIHAFLLKQNNKVFVCQRANQGIWAGLWFLPTVDDKGLLKIKHKVKIFSFKHILSHRIMRINIYQIKTKPQELKGRWVDIKSLDTIPHPSALKRIINEIKIEK